MNKYRPSEAKKKDTEPFYNSLKVLDSFVSLLSITYLFLAMHSLLVTIMLGEGRAKTSLKKSYKITGRKFRV